MWQVLGGLRRGTSPTLVAVDEVARMTSAVLARLSTTVLLPDDRTKEVTLLTLNDAGLESSHRVERVDAAGHFLTATSEAFPKAK